MLYFHFCLDFISFGFICLLISFCSVSLFYCHQLRLELNHRMILCFVGSSSADPLNSSRDREKRTRRTRLVCVFPRICIGLIVTGDETRKWLESKCFLRLHWKNVWTGEEGDETRKLFDLFRTHLFSCLANKETSSSHSMYTHLSYSLHFMHSSLLFILIHPEHLLILD